MANRSAEQTDRPDVSIVRGTANFFADLGYADADERQTKLRLAHAINSVIARQRLTQAAAAEKLRRRPAEGFGAGELSPGRLLCRATDDIPDGARPGCPNRHQEEAAIAGKCADSGRG